MLDKLTAEMAANVAKAAEADIERYLKLEFAIDQRISVHRPWWMPDRLYRRLMRSILIEQSNVRVKP